MTEGDNDLKRMFAAQRKIDRDMAPSFDDIETKSLAARDPAASLARRQFRSIDVVVALAAIALTLVGLVSWINFPRSDTPIVASTSKPELQLINEICDSLLITIGKSEQSATDEPMPDQEMEWPTGTDSLLATKNFYLKFD